YRGSERTARPAERALRGASRPRRWHWDCRLPAPIGPGYCSRDWPEPQLASMSWRRIWASSKRVAPVRKTRELWRAALGLGAAWGPRGSARPSPDRAQAAPNIALQASSRHETGLARGCRPPPAQSALRNGRSDADNSAILYQLGKFRRLRRIPVTCCRW